MQTLTWSPNLHTVIKKLKKLDPKSIESLYSDTKSMSSLCLSVTEEQAVLKSFMQKRNVQPDAYWQ